MNKTLLVLIAIFGASQLVLANIATDIANGVEPMPATEGAKSEGVIPEDAVVQLIAEGIESAEAVKIVKIVYGLTEDCGLSQGNAVTQMTEAGVPQELAIDVVSNRCGDGDCEQTVAPIDSVVVAALEASPEGANTVPTVALFSSCNIGALTDHSPPPIPTPGAGGGTGVSISPN